MTDPRLLDMLKNPDAAKRKAAIQALARSKDPEAIPYLERVADYDQDTDIRDIAEKAIVYINRNNPDNATLPALEKKRESTSYSSPISDGDSYTDEMPLNGGPVMVSPAEEERARRLLSSALDLNMRGDNLKATKAVIEAFKANPNLKDDAYARGVASTATGLNVSEAVVKVMDGSAADLFAPKKGGKAKRDSGGGAVGDLPSRDSDGREAGIETEATFGGALLDLFIYGLVNAVMLGGLIFLFVYVLLSSIPNSALSQEITPGTGVTLGQFVDLINTLALPILLLYSALYGLFSMIYLFFYALVMHWAATSFFNGEGPFAGLLHRVSVFYTILTPIQFILPGIVGVVIIAVGGGSDQTFENAINAVNLVTLGLVIYSGWGVSVRIGRNYEFSTGNGCLTLIVSTMALAALCCALSFGLSYAVGSGMTGFTTLP